MTEYTIVIILTGVLVYILDKYLHTNIFPPSKPLQKTMVVFLIAQLVFDNLFTFFGIWTFNPAHALGVFLPYIPIENLAFGQELLLTALIFYSFFSRK